MRCVRRRAEWCTCSQPGDVPDDVTPKTLRSVGLYAIAVDFSDGHTTGIYSFEHLRKLGAGPSAGFEV